MRTKQIAKRQVSQQNIDRLIRQRQLTGIPIHHLRRLGKGRRLNILLGTVTRHLINIAAHHLGGLAP